MEALAANAATGDSSRQSACHDHGRPNDIQKLMKTIQELSPGGPARDGGADAGDAAEHAGEPADDAAGNGGQSPRDKALNDAMNKLGDVMGKQRALLDKTFRQRQAMAIPRDGGAQGPAAATGRAARGLHDT